MSLLTVVARRLQRTQIHLFLNLISPSLSHSLVPSSSSSSSSSSAHLFQNFSQAFHRTLLTPSLSLQCNLHFCTLLSSHNQSMDEPIDFNEFMHETHQNNQLGICKFVELVENAKRFDSEAEAIGFLDVSALEPNKDLVFSTIWAFRDELKLAFLVFKWGEKWGCNGEKNWDLMIWVLGNHKKFNTAWCLIRDLHRSSMDTRRAMLIMIDRYAAANNPGKAIETFQIMEKFRMTPDQNSFYILLKSLCKRGNIEEAEEFMYLNKKLFPLETDSFNIILNGWSNICVDIFEAKRIWREMSKSCIIPNATSYTHMISCFSKVGNLFDSLRLCDEMKKRGWDPGLEVYNSLIFVLTRENCLKEGLKLLEKMKEEGLNPDFDTYNSMIRPLCEVGKLEEARTILGTMIGENISPTIEIYHAFLEGSCMEETFEVLNHMRKANLGPDGDTFLVSLSKFFKVKQPENALKIWVEMKSYDVIPEAAHYSLMVEGLASCGLLIKARDIYADMRSSGILDDPKLKKLLKEPVRRNSHHREGEEGMRFVRHVKRGTHVPHGKRSLPRRNNHGKRDREKTNTKENAD